MAAASTGACVVGSRAGGGFQNAPHQVEVTMGEYRFEAEPSVGRGRVVVTARNEGTVDHELVLARLPPDFPPIGEQLRGSVRRPVPIVGALPPRGPGRWGTFAVDLEPGRYALICYVRDPDGLQHAAKGMSLEIVVT